MLVAVAAAAATAAVVTFKGTLSFVGFRHAAASKVILRLRKGSGLRFEGFWFSPGIEGQGRMAAGMALTSVGTE